MSMRKEIVLVLEIEEVPPVKEIMYMAGVQGCDVVLDLDIDAVATTIGHMIKDELLCLVKDAEAITNGSD